MADENRDATAGESTDIGLSQPAQGASRENGRIARLRRHPWVVFLLPFIVFMLCTALEPTPDKAGGADIGLSIPYDAYPWVYAAEIVVTVLAVSPLALLLGVVGAFAWVGLCKLGLEQHLWTVVGWEGVGARSQFDPFAQLSHNPAAAWGFLSVRIFGLVAVVPVIEEFFLRGFVMRFCVHADWWKVPFGKVNTVAVVAGTVVPMLTHPGELLAAAIWFSMITWLMIRTRNVWDCVAAHRVTNLLLFVFAVFSDDWSLM
jgi:CAAX prenyl protease-like protein